MNPKRDWFALGGVLINQEDEYDARKSYQKFCDAWEIDYPLHSVEIRSKSKYFWWLRALEETELERFYLELETFLLALPVLGLACVIDRPGYNHRYRDKYGRQRWSLCKTAFNVAVERAAKYALLTNRKLRIYPERCSPKDDNKLQSYFEDLKAEGHSFSDKSDKYKPLKAEDFKNVLYDFKTKYKSSPLSQISDLYLWPMCMAGYPGKNRSHEKLVEHGRLIESVHANVDSEILGTKYSCFDLVWPEKDKGPNVSVGAFGGHRVADDLVG